MTIISGETIIKRKFLHYRQMHTQVYEKPKTTKENFQAQLFTKNQELSTEVSDSNALQTKIYDKCAPSLKHHRSG